MIDYQSWEGKQRQEKVLGVRVDTLSREETTSIIGSWVDEKGFRAKQVVTAYSEFFVAAARDANFRRVLEEADLVLPDGVGGLAAIDYLHSVRSTEFKLLKILKGLRTGVRVLRGRVGEPVPGVWLVSELSRLASLNKWRVFLLGGFGDVSHRLELQLLAKYPGLRVESDPGEQVLGKSRLEAREILEKINRFSPDLLLVAYGPVGQEKWIAENKDKLKVKVAVGVGGSFDELTGKVPPAPRFLEKMGLKWLWRLLREPVRFRRIVDAVVVFPWMVFKGG